jgi:hypothetical protein
MSCGRSVVLVIEDIQPGTSIDNALLSDLEIADLNAARACLRQFSLLCPQTQLCSSVSAAIDFVVAQANIAYTENNGSSPLKDASSSSCAPAAAVTRAHRPHPHRLRKRSSIVLSQWKNKSCNRSHLTNTLMCPRLRRRSSSSTSIRARCHAREEGSDTTNTNQLDHYLHHTLDQHHSLVHTHSIRDDQQHALISSSSSVSSTVSSTTMLHEKDMALVYLGGNLTNTSWRATIAIPMLQKAGIPYYSPTGDFHWVISTPTVEKEADRYIKSTAELILHVIPANCRSITAILDAILLICRARAVLLVIEPMIEGMAMEDLLIPSMREFKDLHRARVYLAEMASRHDVDVFTNVLSAVQAITTYQRSYSNS